MALLATSLPDGIMVKTLEDRMASRRRGRAQASRWALRRLQPWALGLQAWGPPVGLAACLQPFLTGQEKL